MQRLVPWILVMLCLAACDTSEGAAFDAGVDVAVDVAQSAVDVDAVEAVDVVVAVPVDVLADVLVDAAVDVENLPDVPEVADVPVDVGEDIPPCPDPEELLEPAVGGLVYEDGDESAMSFHAQAMQPCDDGPLAGVPVQLIGTDEVWNDTTCPNGRFSFGAVADGVYLLTVDPGEERICTSHSLARRFPEAVLDGEVTIVTFGDSIPVYGGEPHFPAILEALITPLATVDNRVVARPGSTSSEWVPGTNYFENRLVPHLADADIVIGSIGGNDLGEFFGVYDTSFDREELVAKIGEFPEFLEEVTARIVTTLEEIRVQAPQADIVYITYCNYGRSQPWQELSGEYAGLAEFGLDNALRIMRQRIGEVESVLLADMYSGTAGEDLTPYLWDEIHLSTEGAVRWAREIFQVLGGVIVGEDELGLDREYGLSPGAGAISGREEDQRQ